MSKHARPGDGKSQRDRFIETARALGADEDEEAFRAKLRVIARQKPKDESKSALMMEKRDVALPRLPTAMQGGGPNST